MTIAQCGEYITEVYDGEYWIEQALMRFAPRILEDYLDYPEYKDAEITITVHPGEIKIKVFDDENKEWINKVYKIKSIDIPPQQVVTLDALFGEYI